MLLAVSTISQSTSPTCQQQFLNKYLHILEVTKIPMGKTITEILVFITNTIDDK